MTSEGINKFGRIIAVISFAFGTSLFLGYLMFPLPYIMGILAFIYFLVSTALNIGMIGLLIINAIASKDHRHNTGLTSLLLIINVPIQVIYFLLIVSGAFG